VRVAGEGARVGHRYDDHDAVQQAHPWKGLVQEGFGVEVKRPLGQRWAGPFDCAGLVCSFPPPPPCAGCNNPAVTSLLLPSPFCFPLRAASLLHAGGCSPLPAPELPSA